MDELNIDKNNFQSRLSLPAEQYDALDACNATPEALGDYLDKLPHSNAAELCNRLYRLLPQIAGLRLPPGRKISLLDTVTPEVMDCVRRLTNNLAITPSSAKLLSLATALLKHLASGYKSVIVSVLRSPAAPPQLLTEACYSAIGVQREILMNCWECYVTPPANTWLELHAVYQIARSRGIEKTTVHRSAPGQPQDNKIHAVYTIPLMMYCADPGRHTPQDLKKIEQFLQASAHLVEFDSRKTEGIFIVDPDSDLGPQYSFKVENAHPGQFRIKSYRLVRNIEENLATGSLSGLDERLARDLCEYWSTEIQRRQDPEPDNTKLNLIIGLSHTHRYITQTRDLKEFLRKSGQLRERELYQLEIVVDDQPSYRDTFLEKKPPPNAFDRHKQRPTQESAPTPVAPLRRYTAIRTNFSDHGARVEFDGPSETLTAGEVVLLEPLPAEGWQIGIVRWTRVTRRLNRMLGVETLSRSPRACAVSLLTATDSEQYFSGLIFATDGETRIILPALPFKPYSRVRLITPDGQKGELQLRERVDATFHISVFNIEPAGRA